MSNSDTACVAFKGRMMTLTVLEVRDSDITAISTSVQQQVERSPGFFARMPVLLSLHDTLVDLNALREVLTAADLVVVGVLDADEATTQAAQTAGLGVMTSPAGRAGNANGDADQRQRDKGQGRAHAAQAANNDVDVRAREATHKSPTRLVTRPVRSGQQIYARGGDLVVMSSVSEGAEVLADGHIHIYGALRGRALAGASGDTQGRIFCRRFEPDLIAVAGCYKVADAIDEGVRGACVQVRLDNDNLLIELQE